MTTRNSVTGDKIKTKPTASPDYRNNYDAIFRKPAPKKDKK